MKLVDQWASVEAALPRDWETVRLTLAPESDADLPRATAVLGAAGVGRSGDTLTLHVRREGGTDGPNGVRRLFGRLDSERVWSTLAVEGVESAAAAQRVDDAAPATVASSWDEALAPLPPDWSDLLCRLEVSSSDDLDRVALLCAPVNPARERPGLAFTFRCARTAGYGVSPGMARRCFERLDDEGIAASTRVLRVLSDTDNVATQGAVWRVGGRVL